MRRLAALVLCLTLSACASLPSPKERLNSATRLAEGRHWQPLTLQTPAFDLNAFVPRTFSSFDELTIYIEGDGLAWKTASLPSDDPTPNNPIGLKLALAQPEGNAAYLARPCQYAQATTTRCKQPYWTNARFAPEVIKASSQAIDQLKSRFGAKRLALVGYSGGGAVAALVAARRADVVKLVTVAGNLDHQAWTGRHRLTPLDRSLNPVDYSNRLLRIPQWHFVGGGDKVIPPSIVTGFADRFPPGSKPTVIVEPGFDHHCCWVENWARLFPATH